MKKIKKLGCVIAIIMIIIFAKNTCFADAVDPGMEFNNQNYYSNEVNNQSNKTVEDNPEMVIYVVAGGFVLMIVSCTGLIIYAIVNKIRNRKK